MANIKQQLEAPFVPGLGYPPNVYDRRHFIENYAAINNYFQKVTSVLGSVFGPRGGKFINNPHGAFHDETNQISTSTTTAYPVVFSNTDFSNGVSIVSDSRFTVAVDGIWNVQFSLQFKNTTNDGQDVDVWFRKNGTNVPASNSRFHPPARKGAGNPSHIIAALNFFITLEAGDYVEIMWRTENTNVSLEAFGTSTSPTRPAVPSAIATMTFVSNLPS